MEFDIWYSMVRCSNKDKLNLLKKFKNTKSIWEKFCNNRLEKTDDKNTMKLSYTLKKYWDEKI